MKNLLVSLFLFITINIVGQQSLIIEGIETIETSVGGYNIPNSSSTNLIFRNNFITSTSSSGFIVQAGEDDYNSYAYNLNGAQIIGNKILWNGSTGGTHGLMVGYSINYTIKFNYFDSSKYGIVHEGGEPGSITMVNTSGGISYNIIKDCYMGIVEKGFDNTKIYNNTFYTTGNQLFFIMVKSSDTGGYDAVCKNTKIKNNLFYSTTNTSAVRLGSAGDDTPAEIDSEGFECDYNVYYYPNRTNNEPIFMVNDVSLTWAEWRALGYDAHSVIMDPKFIDTKNFVPSSKLEYGVNLGTEFENGLSTTSNWTTGVSPDTTPQGSIWQVGAIITETDGNSTGNTDPVIDTNPGTSYNADYFVAPWGNDNNAGTFDKPWRTWGKAFNSTAVQPGDTVYFRGGTYYHTDKNGGYGYRLERDGTTGNYIHYFNYPGETPVLDCDSIIPTEGSGTLNMPLYTVGINYIHFKGLNVRNVWQNDGADEVITWTIEGDHIIIEQCTIHNTHGVAFKSRNCDNTYFINCDTWNNCDSLTTVPASNPVPGNDGNGFLDFNWNFSTGTVYFQNCRAWLCGDQGFSSGSIGRTEYDNCWSFKNGMLEGGGHGFKMGWITIIDESVTNRIYRNCIAAYNRIRGWDSNDQGYSCGSFNVYNNTSYKNKEGFRIFNTLDTDARELRRVYKNNIAFDNVKNIGIDSGTSYTHSFNSWDIGVTVSNADFVSIDSTGLSAPRHVDGSLPQINFLKLDSTSKLIDAGTNVGLSYNGSSPDLGYSEYESGSTTQPLKIIAYSPNPTTGAVTVSYYSPSATSIAITVNNNAGTQVSSLNQNATVGENNKIDVDLTNFTAGVYTVNLNDGTTSVSCNVTKEDAPRTLEILNSTSTTYQLVNVTIYSPTSSLIYIDITNSNNQIVQEESYTSSIGENELELNINNLPNGTYKITFDDGNTTTSFNVTKEEEPLKLEIIRYYPNPTTDLVAIEFSSPSTTTVQIKVEDLTGIIVLTKNISAKMGNNKTVVDLSSLPTDRYKVSLNIGSTNVSTIIIKQDFQ